VIKLVFCLRRREGMTVEEFQRTWHDDHGPLVRQHAEVLGIRRYVQTHGRPTPLDDALRTSREAPEAYDGVAELWFDSMDALATAAASPEGLAAGAALLEDERRFIDHARSPLFLTEDREIIG
jgi:uncharacterized protein (TIGR02118 family)